MALTFFWRCQATSLDSILDFSAGAKTGSLINSGLISPLAARVGPNGLLRSASVAGGFNMNPNNIFPGNLANPATSRGAIGYSLRWAGTPYNTSSAQMVQFRGTDNNTDYLSFSTQVNRTVGFNSRGSGRTTGAICTTEILPNKWYGLIGRWDYPNNRLECEVYDENNVLLEKAVRPPTDITPFIPVDIIQASNGWRMGFMASSFATPMHIDNVFVANDPDEPIQNFFTINDYTEYNPVTGPVGILAVTEARDDAALSGQVVRTLGTLAVTEARDTGAFTGLNQKQIAGDFAVTENSDVAAFVGEVFDPAEIVGDLRVTETRDGYSGAGQIVRTIGSLTVVEARDSAAFTGLNQKQIDGTLATLEGFDLAAFEGSVYDPGEIVGVLRVTEARDAYAGSGAVQRIIGTMPITEQRDGASFSGLVQKFINGTFAVTEQADKPFFTDGIEEDDVGNTIAARDANYGIGISPEAEWKDGPPSWARNGEDGRINVPHAIGQPADLCNFSNTAVNRQMRLVQALSDTQPGQDIAPGWVTYVFVKAGDWGWALSRSTIVADADNPIGFDDAVPTP